MDEIARRVGRSPILTARDVRPTQPEFEVQAVLNPAAVRLPDGEIVLLVRVAQRPRSDIDPPRNALTLSMEGAQPELTPLPSRYRRDDVVPVAIRNPEGAALGYLPIYLPKDLPGLDLRDPRGVEFTHPTLGWRVTFLTQLSHLRCARSSDGVDFEVDEEPAIVPTTDLEEYGCEDARITEMDGTYYITYSSVARTGITPSLATTRDFRTYTKVGVILPPDQKDLALFPERREGGWMALTRPMPSSFAHVLGIWIALPDPNLPWGAHRPLILPRTNSWDERHTGAGSVPFRCSEGWLEIYHGVDADLNYRLGAALLEGDDPSKVIARSERPILSPERRYERVGLLSDVVYACGHVPLDPDERRIRLYYGAADSCVAAADFEVGKILDSLRGTPASPFVQAEDEAAA